MPDLVILFVHVIATLLRLLRPGGIRSASGVWLCSVVNQLRCGLTGSWSHGSIHSPDHWVRCPGWNGRWCPALPDVRCGHSRLPSDAEVPQLRPRSALSV